MKKVRNFISQVLVSIIFVLCILILSKKDPLIKSSIKLNLYETNISFGYLNTLYNKYLGSIIPFDLNIEPKPVFSEKLNYKNSSKYLDGCVLEVSRQYLVPSIGQGLVVFIGEKEGYGKTIIVEDSNGIEIWYSNIDNISISLYDYIEKGTYLASTIDDKLYLVFKKNGEVLNYEEYIN